MKRIPFLFPVVIVLVFLAACSEEAPSIRVRNDLDVKVNVQVKPDAGSTMNINDVQGGETSVMQDVQEGMWTASASVQSSSAEPEARFETKNDMNYTLVILNTSPPRMEVQAEEK